MCITIIIGSYLIYDTYIIIPTNSYIKHESNGNPARSYNIQESIPITMSESTDDII